MGVQPASPPACGAASRPGQIEHERPGTVVYRRVGGVEGFRKTTLKTREGHRQEVLMSCILRATLHLINSRFIKMISAET